MDVKDLFDEVSPPYTEAGFWDEAHPDYTVVAKATDGSIKTVVSARWDDNAKRLVLILS